MSWVSWTIQRNERNGRNEGRVLKRLTSAKVRYVKSRLTGNAAAGNACNVADMASLLQAVRNAGANGVVILGA